MYSLNGGTFQVSGTFNNLAGTTYTITVQDANLCTANVPATIVEPAAISIAGAPVPASCPDVPDGSITLTITGGTQPYNMIWSDGVITPGRQNIAGGTYSVVVTDNNGCAASLDVVVGITASDKCIEIPTIITPNNDGVNDTWQIKNIDLFPNAEVFVFTRWGKLIFHSKNLAANPWNGTFEGTLLPTDSYHYVLHLNDGSKTQIGCDKYNQIIITIFRIRYEVSKNYIAGDFLSLCFGTAFSQQVPMYSQYIMNGFLINHHSRAVMAILLLILRLESSGLE